MNKKIPAVILFCLTTLALAPAAADFEAGIDANRSGDRVTAFNEFQAAARDQDERAYGKLASMYLYGLGTEKNYEQAYVWFHMAYLAGENEAERFRDAAASMLSATEVSNAREAAEAQRLELGLAKKRE